LQSSAWEAGLRKVKRFIVNPRSPLPGPGRPAFPDRSFHRAARLQAPQISEVQLIGDRLAGRRTLKLIGSADSFGPSPAPVFDVAIRKREIASSAVAIRRQVGPSLVGPVGDADKTDIEKGIFNDPLVVIDHTRS